MTIVLISVVSIAIFGAIAFMLIKQMNRVRQLETLMTHTNAKLERLQLNFGRFTPEEVIEHLTDPDGSYRPNKRVVTVLFADLQGFTRMCEDLDPEEIVSILNGYFMRMGKVITRNHGQITEMLGDGFLALFGALRNNPWQVQDAVNAALEMRRVLDEYNRELLAKGYDELKFGVGIHRGEVLAGVIGNLDLSKFGVVGDAINTAARIEGLTRHHRVDLLISDEVMSQLDERFDVVAMPATKVKGKENFLKTYHVKGVVESK